MARLYATLVDEKGTEVHKTAHDSIVVRFYYGSRQNSKHAVSVRFTWLNENEKPDLAVMSYNCDVEVK